jgi:hypothetical protein
MKCLKLYQLPKEIVLNVLSMYLSLSIKLFSQISIKEVGGGGRVVEWNRENYFDE